MKFAHIALAVLLAGVWSIQSVSAQTPKGRNGNSERFVHDEILIKFSPGALSVRAGNSLRSNGADVVETLGRQGWRRVKIPPGLTPEKAMRRFEKLEGVEAVQPNYYYNLLVEPNDPQFNTSGLWGLAKISAPAAWDLSTGSQTVVVANIDTGIRYTHEDLAANMWTNPGEINSNGVDDDGNGFVDDYYGYDFFYNDSDPMDVNGHGTHTAGTIGARGNNGLGVVGVNWNVRIMAVKIYSLAGNDTTSAMLINAYNYVRMMKERGVNIRVTNNSYGGCLEACGFDQATKDAIDELGDAGILNVFAAGNSHTDNDVIPHYPSNYTSPSILAVAASTKNNDECCTYNFGPTSVDIAAPGVGILSTYSSSNNSYALLSGTSMATPHVTGAAALLSAYRPELSVASLKATLMNSVDVLPSYAERVKSGGRLNVANALQNPTVCTFSLSQSDIFVQTKGGHYSVSVSAPQNCDYSVRSSDHWIFVYGDDARSGNGTIEFRVGYNTAISRTGTITIAGQTFTVTQTRGGIN